MAGELLIQVIDIGQFRAIRPALDEVKAGRALGLESRTVLREAAASPFPRGDLNFAGLLARILRHPELELRVFLAQHDLDAVIEGVVHVLCFENGAEFSLTTLVGPSWVVLDSAFGAFMDLDWFRALFLNAALESESSGLPYPRRFDLGYRVLRREDVARMVVGLRPLLDDPAVAFHVQEAAQGIARLAARALSREELTLAHTSLL